MSDEWCLCDFIGLRSSTGSHAVLYCIREPVVPRKADRHTILISVLLTSSLWELVNSSSLRQKPDGRNSAGKATPELNQYSLNMLLMTSVCDTVPVLAWLLRLQV